jgi:hypothetical protein
MTNPLSSRWLLLFLPLLLGLAAVTGCGGIGSEKLVTVTGKVTLDGGVPMTAGTITFQPDDSKGNKSRVSPEGFVDGSGNYKLMTGQREGAPLGWYKVGVSPIGGNTPPPPLETGKNADPNKNLSPSGGAVPKKYQIPATSGLSVEVVEKPNAGAYDLKVTK